MQRPLSEHIAYLERKVEAIRRALSDPDLGDLEKADLRLDLDMAERALAHFHKAFDLEQRVSR
jgi:hypothetical protein